MDSAISGIDNLLATFDDEKKENQNDEEPEPETEIKMIANVKDIKCQSCDGILLHKGIASSKSLTQCIKIHDYKGRNFEDVEKCWEVEKMTDFETLSVSRAVNIGTTEEMNQIILTLVDENVQNTNNLTLRYLMCSGPTMDLSALFGSDPVAKQKAQKLLNTPQQCEKLIIGIAVFEGNDYKCGFVDQKRVVH